MSRTTLALALVVAAIPAIAGAQQDSTRTQQDSTRRGSSARSSGRTTQSRGGEIDRGNGSRNGNGGNRAFRGRNYGLDQDQTRQLQEAISSRTECDPGSPDGMMGPKTRRALTCARKELGIRGNDMGELFSALGLEFSSDDTGSSAQGDDMQGNNGNRGNRANAGNRGTSGNRSNAGNRGTTGNRGRSGRDSTMRDSSRGQSPDQQRPR